MDPRRNPYAPGAGVRPAALVGREALTEEVDIVLDRVRGGLHATSLFLIGPRGVGKTVLLRQIEAMALGKGFETIRLELQADRRDQLVAALTPELHFTLGRLDREYAVGEAARRALRAVRTLAAQFRIKIGGVSVGTEAPADAAPELDRDLPAAMLETAKAAKAAGTAVAILIDEVQNLTLEELGALTRAFHLISQEVLPMVLVATGLPNTRSLVGELKSYAERLFEFPEVDALPPEAVHAALREPAAPAGVEFEPGALDLVVEKSGGYPYFVQTWGKYLWNHAEASPITAADVAAVEPRILHHLDQSFFGVRLEPCTDAQRRYLRGLAELGPGPHAAGAVAEALSSRTSALGPVRKRLDTLGIVYTPRYGEVEFTVPHFDAFMRRVMPELEPYRARSET